MGALTDALGLTGGGQQDMLNRMMQGAQIGDPFGSQREQYQADLSALIADPSQITKDPGYMFSLQQGEQGLLRNQAATGGAGSGAEKIALQSYDQGFSMNYLNQALSMLAGLGGANIAPGANPLASGSIAAAEMNMQRGSNLFGLMGIGYQALSGSGSGGGLLAGLFGGGSAAGLGTTTGMGAVEGIAALA